MAQAGVFLEQDQFNCSICLDVLKDPVTVPCGHSYCKGCIKGYWDQDDYLGIYGCPQCRQSFAPRPVLGRNTMLADVVDKLKKTGLFPSSAVPEAPMSEPTFAEPGDVECDVCIGRKNKAFRSCLVCLASYCETHLKPHYESPAFQKHRLTAPSNKLQDSLCSRHDKLLEVFCRTDQHCICYLCLTDEHKGHDTVLASAEMTEKKNTVAEMQRNSQQKIQEREKELQDLRQATQSLTLSAQAALEESERIFTELVCSIERRRTEVKELIRAQERAATGQAEELLRQLEREIAELKKRDTELGQLVQAEDHISFLQNYRSACIQPVTMDVPGITVDPGFGCVMSAVSEFQALLEDVCQGGFVNISEKVKDVIIIHNTKPKADTELNAALPPVAQVTFPVTPIFQSFGSQNAFGAAAPTFSGFTFTSFVSKYRKRKRTQSRSLGILYASRPSGARLRTQQRRRRR
ncbi:LOW QUALITY PROTEIN: finTRIM family, member 67 [Colossoma macropomum]|uniref:LOW QUALITY PROTEIN: finTRIM family, member 67 n=1 Tax=Colossoma macropomum TaxID=42526 RepID=UPI0018641FFC|nr:LOW QUALITY PROTEIN: finTRIM family, member 67 [Colossoma macropomum]